MLTNALFDIGTVLLAAAVYAAVDSPTTGCTCADSSCLVLYGDLGF